MAISVLNYGAGNVLFGKIIHSNFSDRIEYKEKYTFDKPPNVKTQEIFPNPVFWEFSKTHITCPNIIKRVHFTMWNSLFHLRASNKKFIQTGNTVIPDSCISSLITPHISLNLI